MWLPACMSVCLYVLLANVCMAIPLRRIATNTFHLQIYIHACILTYIHTHIPAYTHTDIRTSMIIKTLTNQTVMSTAKVNSKLQNIDISPSRIQI